MKRSDLSRLAGELFGTFALVFAGTGAMVVNDVSGGAITHVGIALTFGLIVLSMIYALGDVSGCHLNPAVTISFCAARRFEIRMVLPYIISQILGAILASVILKLLFPAHLTLGATLPAGGALQSFVLELILTIEGDLQLSHPSRLIVRNRRTYLLARVHDERSLADNRFI
jgi:aquaporin NIP